MPLLPEPVNHTTEAIYEALKPANSQGDGRGVPMSNAANECHRAIWYALRWASAPEEITGQKQSRFNTGTLWEDRLLKMLAAAGVEVESFDPATGQQFRVELANGWLRGKMDGRALGVPEAPKTLHVVECKSHSEKSFKELVKHSPLGSGDREGIRKSKPEHFAQCQAYMHAQGITRTLYLAVNKNTDDLYTERVEYDATYSLMLEAKIERVAASEHAPFKLHEDPKSKAAFACQWCPALELCHQGGWARRNCRTCLSASFEDGAVVRCALTGAERSYDEQQAGCDQHLYLPSLVPGEQIDAGDRWVKYQMPDGSDWIDGDRAEDGRAA